MQQREFFLDTADIDYNKNCWSRFGRLFSKENCLGVTTNPNAISKVGVTTVREFEKVISGLCRLVTEIRGDDLGTVFVQGPSSSMTPKQQLEFVKLVKDWTDGHTKIGLKIPPFYHILEIVDELGKHAVTNVTGLADCSNALRATSYNVDYISIIPGRMEEHGIDAKANIRFVSQRKPNKTKIITGSMRTVEGLDWVIKYGTVPTIGAKVLDEIWTPEEIEKFYSMWDCPVDFYPSNYSPLVTPEMVQLSEDFFAQMDECGKSIFIDLARKRVL
jgi:transaldolase